MDANTPDTPDLSEDEIRRRLAAAGLPSHHPMVAAPDLSAPAGSASPSYQAAPSVPGMGSGASPFPSAPKPPTYAPPASTLADPAASAPSYPSTPKPQGYGTTFDPSATPAFSGVPAQPRAPRSPEPDTIPGFEDYDQDEALQNIAAKLPGHTGQTAFLARQAQLHGGSQGNGGGQVALQTQAEASPIIPPVGYTGTTSRPNGQPGLPPQTQAAAPGQNGQPPKAKSYTVSEDGNVQFDHTNATASVLDAFKDGVLDGQGAQTALENARRVEAAHGDVAKFLEDHPQIASAAEGLSTGGAFLAGGKAATLAATVSGVNPWIAGASVELGPFAWVPPAIAAGAEFVAGGTLASWAKRKAENRLAEYSDAVRALQTGAKAHPTTATVASYLPMLPEAVLSVGNLAKVGGIAAENLGAAATTSTRTRRPARPGRLSAARSSKPSSD